MKYGLLPCREDLLLTRPHFDEYVKLRNKGLCVFCSKPAVDAHHVLDRKLYKDGGYYLGNGAAVCSEHHLDCERTIYTVEEVRKAAKILFPVLPTGFNVNYVYDKWGNRVLPNGFRSLGPLGYHEGMMKALRVANLHWKILQCS